MTKVYQVLQAGEVVNTIVWDGETRLDLPRNCDVRPFVRTPTLRPIEEPINPAPVGVGKA